MSSRPSVSEATYLGMITVVALTIAIIVAGEINHLNRPLWRGQDLPHGGEIVVVGIKDFSVLRFIDAGTSIADRLKRAAQPKIDASEEEK
jgi:hypothetical protein